MIVRVIELLFVLACLQSSGAFTCNECKQLHDELYAVNCNNTCVEDQNETVEEPKNCTEVNKEIGFLETPSMRVSCCIPLLTGECSVSCEGPSCQGCKQRQNETEKPRNFGMFHGRNKRGEDKLLTCQKCRMFEKEGSKIECEKICALSCRQCDERSKKTGENCEDVCGETPMTCRECRQKEEARMPVDCEFTCAKSCYDCEEKPEKYIEDCEFFCGKPRLPCEVCRKKEQEEVPVNCEWTCEASCMWCHKLQKRLGKNYRCKMYCGQTPSPCLECRKNAIDGAPVDCGKKCEKPCLECRKAEKNGRPVDCTEVCECSVPCEDSTCVGCKVTQEMTGTSRHCERFCGKYQGRMEVKSLLTCEECKQKKKKGELVSCEKICGKNKSSAEDELILTCEECKQKKKRGELVSCEKICGKNKSSAEDELKPLPCNVCRSKEEKGENVDCEWNCDAACRSCEARQKKTKVQLYCEKLCGLPPRPCQTCREREKEGETLNCEWTCASSCIMCEKMERKTGDREHCERFCGQPPLPCRACREKEKKGESIDCKALCVTTCRECREAEKMSSTSQQCERFCGKQQPTVETLLTCEECKQKKKRGELVSCEKICGKNKSSAEDELNAMSCEDCLKNGDGKHPASCAEECVTRQDMPNFLGNMTCVSCNGITQDECNIPFRDNKDFTVICEQECEIATFYKTQPDDDEEPKELLVIRGCIGVSESIPAGFILHQIEPCNSMARCNAYDEFILGSSTPTNLERMRAIRQKKSASVSRRMSIHLAWLLFTYHSVF